MLENLRRPTHVTKGGAVMFKVHKRETRDGSVPFVNAAKYLRDRFRKRS